MKNSFWSLIIAGGVLASAACGGNSSDSNTTDTTTTTKAPDSAATAATNATRAQQDFVNYAVPGNTKEIIWLKSGISNAQSKEVKKHASMMLKDHQALDSTVKNYLSNHSGLSVPNVDTANVVDISAKKGADWDKAWVDKMVADHSDLLSKLQSSQKEVTDTALLSIINNTIPVVESHLAMVKTIKTK